MNHSPHRLLWMLLPLLALAACARTPTVPTPTEIVFEANGSWWSSTPASDLATASELRIELLFVLDAPEGAAFDGAETYQLWVTDADETYLGDVVAVEAALPPARVATGDVFGYVLLVDSATLPEGAAAFSFRAIDNEFLGTLGTDGATLVEGTVVFD